MEEEIDEDYDDKERKLEIPAHEFEPYTLVITQDNIHMVWWNLTERRLTCEVIKLSFLINSKIDPE